VRRRRFTAFTEQLQEARHRDVRRVLVVDAMLVVALALGFGYGLQRVSDASDRADSANRAVAALNKNRSIEAKNTAHNAVVAAYAACRRQQESQAITRQLYHFLGHVADSDPKLQAEFDHLYADLQARGLLEVPKCQKPPKGT
jgi:hypothetical protein